MKRKPSKLRHLTCTKYVWQEDREVAVRPTVESLLRARQRRRVRKVVIRLKR